METEVTTEEVTQPRGARHRNEPISVTSPSVTSPAVTLGPRDVLVGKLTVDGDVRIQGTLEGELNATGDVTVENQATVKATIEGRNVQVRGNLSGGVVAREKLLLAGSGMVSGDVKVARLAIEDGATLNGNVSMQAPNAAAPSRHHEPEPEGSGQ
ncbi:MAG: bactofilin family protein [Candidatus Dormibacteraceae bacterium]